MNRIFKELPTVLPFYTQLNQQSRFRENALDEPFKLYCYRNSLLPFQIEVDATKIPPSSFSIVDLAGNEIDLQLNQLEVYEYGTVKKIIHKGAPLKRLNGANLFLTCGYYYARMRFDEGGKPNYLYSEIFFVPMENLATQQTIFGKFIMFEFWNDTDMEPIIYRNNFRQRIFLDTFVSSYTAEIEIDAEKDGENTEIPIFRKMITRYKINEFTPNFLTSAIISMQMHDHVTITTNDGRTGSLKKIAVNAEPDETGFMHMIEIIFDDEMLINTHCNDQKPYINAGNW